jgi:hypothetical protein
MTMVKRMRLPRPIAGAMGLATTLRVGLLRHPTRVGFLAMTRGARETPRDDNGKEDEIAAPREAMGLATTLRVGLLRRPTRVGFLAMTIRGRVMKGRETWIGKKPRYL